MNHSDYGLIDPDCCSQIDVSQITNVTFNEYAGYLSILNLNVRGLRSNFTLLKGFLSVIHMIPKIIVITESHLEDNEVNHFNLNGYRQSFTNRSRLGGGIMVYIHHSLDYSINDKFSGVFNSHESLFFTLKLPCNKKIDFLCIYRPPNNDMTEFTQFLRSIPDRVYRGGCVIVGDLNKCPTRDISTSHYIDMKNFLNGKQFRQLVKYPTFFSYNASPSILDHVWTNTNFTSHCFVFTTPVADHVPSVTFLKVSAKLPNVRLRFRDFSKLNISYLCETFHDKFDSFYRELFFNCLSLNQKFKFLTQWLEAACEFYFPIREKIVSHRRYTQPWMTTDIVKLIRKKHKLFSVFKKGLITYESFSTYCKGLKVLLRLVENCYHRRRFNDLKHDLRKKWRHLSGLLGRDVDDEINEISSDSGSSLTEPEEQAKAFKEFFTNIPKKLQSELPRANSNFGLVIEENPVSLETFEPVTEGEILIVLNDLKNNSTLSDIPVRFLKLISPFVAKVLCPLFNDCLEQGYYPRPLKQSNIRPIFKAGDKTCLKNYRPISLLPTINKIFEKIIYKRIYKFFATNHLISDNQFGFLRERSTTQAIIKLIDHALPAISNKNFSVIVMIDLSKAFDCVDHRLLIAKLHRYGLRGEALKLLISYL